MTHKPYKLTLPESDEIKIESDCAVYDIMK